MGVGRCDVTAKRTKRLEDLLKDWHIDNRSGFLGANYIRAGKGKKTIFICGVDGQGKGNEKLGEALANIIASVPEMVEALTRLATMDASAQQIRMEARRALAAIEGRNK